MSSEHVMYKYVYLREFHRERGAKAPDANALGWHAVERQRSARAVRLGTCKPDDAIAMVMQRLMYSAVRVK